MNEIQDFLTGIVNKYIDSGEFVIDICDNNLVAILEIPIEYTGIQYEIIESNSEIILFILNDGEYTVSKITEKSLLIENKNEREYVELNTNIASIRTEYVNGKTIIYLSDN